jgi:hypothetical protein
MCDMYGLLLILRTPAHLHNMPALSLGIPHCKIVPTRGARGTSAPAPTLPAFNPCLSAASLTSQALQCLSQNAQLKCA